MRLLISVKTIFLIVFSSTNNVPALSFLFNPSKPQPQLFDGNPLFLTDIENDEPNGFLSLPLTLPCANHDPRNHRRRRGLIKLYSSFISRNQSNSSTVRFRLPVFPLRKSVRIPTDELTLNLYEVRYLAMSEEILGMTTKSLSSIEKGNKLIKCPTMYFGAIYASHKPQRITDNGDGPIVPMLDVGDVGVICHVQEWQDGWIPSARQVTSSSKDETSSGTLSDKRRRISLNAIAVTRFKIEKIIHDGCGSDIPYIVVDASLIRDEGVDTKEDRTKINHLENELKMFLQQSNVQNPRRFFGSTDDEAGESLSSSSSSSSEENYDKIVDLALSLVKSDKEVSYEGESNHENDEFMRKTKEDFRSEVFSFAATARVSGQEQSPQDLLQLLKMDSTLKRMEQLLKSCRQRNDWWRF